VKPADLTDRQREVAELVADGLTTKRIAFKLGISERRVNVHISSIAFLIGAEPEKDERVSIANWWHRHELAA
jgi:DNA-binding NarL/FixJ family response regulator